MSEFHSYGYGQIHPGVEEERGMVVCRARVEIRSESESGHSEVA